MFVVKYTKKYSVLLVVYSLIIKNTKIAVKLDRVLVCLHSHPIFLSPFFIH